MHRLKLSSWARDVPGIRWTISGPLSQSLATNKTPDGGHPKRNRSSRMFMSNIMIQVLLVLGVLTAGYFFLIRPQLRRITEHNRLLSSLKLGDQVVTGGGLIGTIVEFEGTDILGIELANTIRVRALRSSIEALSE
jgi:preprotein translocase YajC subunit